MAGLVGVVDLGEVAVSVLAEVLEEDSAVPDSGVDSFHRHRSTTGEEDRIMVGRVITRTVTEVVVLPSQSPWQDQVLMGNELGC